MENVSSCVRFVVELVDPGGKGNSEGLLSRSRGELVLIGAQEMFSHGQSRKREAA